MSAGLHKARNVSFFLLNLLLYLPAWCQLGTHRSLSAFHCCDKMFDVITLERGKFISANSGGSSPWSVDNIALGVERGHESLQKNVMGRAVYFMRVRTWKGEWGDKKK